MATDRQGSMDRVEGEMTVADPRFHVFGCNQLQGSCSYTQTYDSQGGFLQLDPATLKVAMHSPL